MNNLVQCKKCSWVHFTRTKKEIKTEVDNFNKFYDTLSKKQQLDYYSGKRSYIKNYLYCFRCSTSYRNMSDIITVDILGCTLNPILSKVSY